MAKMQPRRGPEPSLEPVNRALLSRVEPTEFPPSEVVAAPVDVPAKLEPCKWACSLSCPTPIAHPTLTVEAMSESEAKQKFFDANGISGSDHPLTITRAE